MLVLLLLTVLHAPLPTKSLAPLPALMGGWNITFRCETEDPIYATIEFMEDGTGRIWYHGEPDPKPFKWERYKEWVTINDSHSWGLRIKDLRTGDVTVAGTPAKMRRIR